MRGRSVPIKELGQHPTLNEPMAVFTGKYGPYVKCGKTNVSLPDDMTPETVTPEKAIELLSTKIATTAATKPAKAKKAKNTAEKPANAKKTAKKADKKVIRRVATSKESAPGARDR